MDLWQAYTALYSASALLTLAAGIDAWRRRRDTPLGGPVAVMMVALA